MSKKSNLAKDNGSQFALTLSTLLFPFVNKAW